MLQSHYIIDIGIFRQQLPFDALNRELNHPLHTLHGGGDGKNVTGTDRAIWITVSLKGVAFECWLRFSFDGTNRQIIERTGRWHP